MEVRLTVREAGPSEVVEDTDGSGRRRGSPLRNFLDRMNTNDGWVDVRLSVLKQDHTATSKVATTLKTVTTSSPVVNLEAGSAQVPFRVVDENTVQVNLNQWRDSDPDNTYLVVGWHVVNANPAS
ncbi:MAG TPA: hypothetical protein VI248_03365 [Kineosporiaceae bacterium]